MHTLGSLYFAHHFSKITTMVDNIEDEFENVKTTFFKHLQQCTTLFSFKHLPKTPKASTQTWNEKLNEVISCNTIIELLPNISNHHHLNIYGNAFVVKPQTKFKPSCPIYVSKETHTKRIALEDWGVTTNLNLPKTWNSFEGTKQEDRRKKCQNMAFQKAKH